MANLLELLPIVNYECDATRRKVLLTNIARRYVVQKTVLGRSMLFETYNVQDGERPDVVAHRYYGDSQLDWLVMLANQILHPQFDWFMGYQDFKAFLAGKYGSVEDAHRTIHSYEKQLVVSRQLLDGTATEDFWVTVDRTTYLATPAETRREVTCYEYEKRINQARQRIQLIHKSYANQIKREIETLIKAI